MQSKKIAVLFHKKNSRSNVKNYVVHSLAQYWRADGHQVDYIFGIKNFRSADLILVHIDLSVVPDEYLDFAHQYRIVLNGKVKDIRKCVFSQQLLKQDDVYDGPVFVKSNLNYAGVPERSLMPPMTRILSGAISHFSCEPKMRNVSDYRVFDHLSEVPNKYFAMPDVVIEKFLPEMENGYYVIRNYQFLGDRETCTKLLSIDPMVKGKTAIANIRIEPDREIIALRHTMGFDYGKFDYVMRDGKVVLFDVNKTTGANALRLTPQLRDMRRYRAAGLYSYF
jgi:hypothetical protein